MDTILRKLQLTQLEILKVIDNICSENNINYSLCGGTLLGAVRHKGFIPWDDDLDIRMSRSDYERFIKVWGCIKPEGYILQNHNNEITFPSSFTKIRKDHTAFVQIEWEQGLFHTGIFVDVFPFDRIPKRKIQKWVYYYRCYKYQIYLRGNCHYLNSQTKRIFVGLITGLVSQKKKEKYIAKFERLLRTYHNNREWKYVATDSIKQLDKELPSDITDEYVRLEFEGCEFMCFKKWEIYLKTFYGNYMQLPPESERKTQHHPILIDFEHNYEEIAGKVE